MDSKKFMDVVSQAFTHITAKAAEEGIVIVMSASCRKAVDVHLGPNNLETLNSNSKGAYRVDFMIHEQVAGSFTNNKLFGDD